MSKGTKQTVPIQKTKAAEKANLIVNPNSVKKAIKEYYKNKDIEYSKISGGHIAFASLLESMTKFLIEQAIKTVGINKSGLRELTREGLNASIIKNKEYASYFMVKANDYDEKFVYHKEVPIMPKEMDEILKSYPAVTFTNEVKNYIYFLLYTMFTNIAVTCTVLLDYAKKVSLDGNCVMKAVTIEFPKSIALSLVRNIDVAIKSSGNTEDEDEDEGDDESAKTADDTVEEKKGKGKKDTPAPNPKTDMSIQPKAGPQKTTTGPGKKTTPTTQTTKPKGGKQQQKAKPIDIEDEDESNNNDEQAANFEDETPEPKEEKKLSKKPSVSNNKSKK